MAKLIYSAIASLDGYVADEDGNFDWAAPDDEVHSFVNDLERAIGTYLYGRRMYEVMVFWETAHTLADQPPVARDFAKIWQSADRTSPVRRSEPGWSTSTTCSSRRSWWVAASNPFPTVSAGSLSCWTNAASATAWFISTTGRRPEEVSRRCSPRRPCPGRS